MITRVAAARADQGGRSFPRLRRARLPLLLVVAVAVAASIASFVVDPLTGHFQGAFEDFSAYLGAARSMAAGGSPYAQFNPSTVVMSGFIYPPFAALCSAPSHCSATSRPWTALALASAWPAPWPARSW